MHDIIFGVIMLMAGAWMGYAIATLLNVGRDENHNKDTTTLELNEEKVKKLQEEFGMRGAIKVLCILNDVPMDILRPEHEINNMKNEAPQ